MEELIEKIWLEIDAEWGQVIQTLHAKLPTTKEVMFDDTGSLVPANRPMIESIICDKAERSNRLFFYLCAADIVSLPEADFSIKQLPGGGREIHINGFSSMPMGTGGKEVVERITDSPA